MLYCNRFQPNRQNKIGTLSAGRKRGKLSLSLKIISYLACACRGGEEQRATQIGSERHGQVGLSGSSMMQQPLRFSSTPTEGASSGDEANGSKTTLKEQQPHQQVTSPPTLRQHQHLQVHSQYACAPPQQYTSPPLQHTSPPQQHTSPPLSPTDKTLKKNKKKKKEEEQLTFVPVTIRKLVTMGTGLNPTNGEQNKKVKRAASLANLNFDTLRKAIPHNTSGPLSGGRLKNTLKARLQTNSPRNKPPPVVSISGPRNYRNTAVVGTLTPSFSLTLSSPLLTSPFPIINDQVSLAFLLQRWWIL